MTSNESELRPISDVSIARSLYCRLRTTFDWSGVFTVLIQALVVGLAFGTGAAFLTILTGVLVTAAALFANRRQESIGRENSEPRSWKNAVANLGVATGCATLSLLASPSPLEAVLAVAAVASLAASLSDSLSHDIGILGSSKPRLITTWAQVEPGESGAISLLGSSVGIVAAFGLTGLAVFINVIGGRAALIAAIAACLGNLIDSLLGAVFERRGWLGNEAVNFSAVFSSALLVLITFTIFVFI